MKEKIESLFKTIDKKDAAGFVSFLAEGASFKFANTPEVVGRENIQNAVANFFSSIKGLRHRILMVYEAGDFLICEGEVTYIKHDGTELTLPFADILKIKGGLISDYRIYMDPSPLYNK
ncbi:MAG: nuclear transport factor 2 family protein [Candidatus Omnitrophota bacterium]